MLDDPAVDVVALVVPVQLCVRRDAGVKRGMAGVRYSVSGTRLSITEYRMPATGYFVTLTVTSMRCV
jgi:hypothetical protein